MTFRLFLSAALKFAAAIPLWVWCLLLALVFALASAHYRDQRNDAREQTQAVKAAYAEHLAKDRDAVRRAKTLAKTRDTTTATVQVKYVDRFKVVHERGRTIIKEVPVYVPADSCALPGGFRLLHDAAALGVPLPGPAAIADAAPVPAQDVARTVAENYTGCRGNAEAVNGWNEWAAEQKRLNP